jgi:hypothetical protein
MAQMIVFIPYCKKSQISAPCAGIFKPFMGARNRVGRNRVVVPARQDTQPGGIGSLESIFGLLQSLKIRALVRGP